MSVYMNVVPYDEECNIIILTIIEKRGIKGKIWLPCDRFLRIIYLNYRCNDGVVVGEGQGVHLDGITIGVSLEGEGIFFDIEPI